MGLTWLPWGSLSRGRKGFANKITFSRPVLLFRGLLCSTNPEDSGLGVLQDENPAHDGMPASSSQAISAFPLPGEAHREEMEEEGGEELKLGAARAVPELLWCPVPSGSHCPHHPPACSTTMNILHAPRVSSWPGKRCLQGQERPQMPFCQTSWPLPCS